MKKLGIIIFIAALCLGVIVSSLFSLGGSSSRIFDFSFKFDGVHGSGEIASDVRDLKGFRSIDVGGVFHVEITAQQEFGVEVEADDNLLPLITTRVVDGTLRIETEQRLKPTSAIRIRISAPDIERLDVSGAAKLTLTDLNNSGLIVDSSGASKITLSGETSELAIDISGATKVDADGLAAQTASVTASGASHASVNVSGDLIADASGASNIQYAGEPGNVKEKSSGASRVSPK